MRWGAGMMSGGASIPAKRALGLTLAVLVCCVLSATHAGAASDVSVDWADDIPGTPLLVSPTSDDLGYVGDTRDVWSRELEEFEWIEFQLEGDAGTDFDLELFGPGATSVADDAYIVDADYTSTYPDNVSYQATSGGTLNLDVYVGLTGAGGYDLSWNHRSNDAIFTAPMRPKFGGTLGHISRHSDSDDIFWVRLDAGDRVLAGATPAFGGGFNLFLYPPDATDVWVDPSVAASDGGGGLQTIDYTVPAGVTDASYYMDVNVGPISGGSGYYNLEFTTIETEEGPNRYETAVAVSQEYYPDGSTQVMLATGSNWPDALGAAGLAGAKDSPILLTRSASLPAVTLAEIKRLGPDSVRIIGGEGAVSAEVEQELNDAGFPTIRHGGANRYETSLLVAKAVIDERLSSTAMVATGRNYPDALSGSPIAADLGAPLFLESSSGLSEGAYDMMADAGIVQVLILGGEDVVSKATELRLSTDYDVVRLEGPTRYETSIAVADYAIDFLGFDSVRAGIATGRNFPDALVAGPAMVRDSIFVAESTGPLLLVQPDYIPTAPYEWLDAHSDNTRQIRVFGGAGAINDGVYYDLQMIETDY